MIGRGAQKNQLIDFQKKKKGNGHKPKPKSKSNSADNTCRAPRKQEGARKNKNKKRNPQKKEEKKPRRRNRKDLGLKTKDAAKGEGFITTPPLARHKST